MVKLCLQCGKPLKKGEENFLEAIVNDPEEGVALHGGKCFLEYLDSIEDAPEYERAPDKTRFIRFTVLGQPIEPVTRSDALREVQRLQNLSYRLIDSLKEYDKRKAEAYYNELES